MGSARLWRRLRPMGVSVNTHPEHLTMAEVAAGVWEVSQPIRPTGLLGWRIRRACRRRGGHWWHPTPGSLIDWFCCQCGQECDGWPKDGS